MQNSIRRSHMFSLIGFSVFISILSGCKKDYPVASNGNPVFYFSGNIDGSPVSLKAGVNDYYMYSSYVQDSSSNVYGFLGDLKQTNCTNCNNRIQFRLNDFRVSLPGASVSIDSSLLSGYYPFQILGGVPILHSVNFTAVPSVDSSSTPSSYLWNFGDGTTSSIANPKHVFARPGDYNVCLTINYSNSPASSICNIVNVGVPNSTFYASIQSSVAVNTMQFTGVVTGGTPPFNYSWDFGDGNTSTLQNGTHFYSSANIYKVCLQVKDANGYITNSCSNISTQNFPGCITNFNFKPDTLGVSNPFAFSNVTILWTDNSGIAYTSNNSSQPTTSYFQIISVENYIKNQNNQSTKKLHVKFKCTVYNGNNTHIIDNGDAVIAVSYK